MSARVPTTNARLSSWSHWPAEVVASGSGKRPPPARLVLCYRYRVRALETTIIRGSARARVYRIFNNSCHCCHYYKKKNYTMLYCIHIIIILYTFMLTCARPLRPSSTRYRVLPLFH